MLYAALKRPLFQGGAGVGFAPRRADLWGVCLCGKSQQYFSTLGAGVTVKERPLQGRVRAHKDFWLLAPVVRRPRPLVIPDLEASSTRV
jgi:hypothetical protein